MWSQKISFPRTLRNVQLVDANGEFAVIRDTAQAAKQTTHPSRAPDVPDFHQPLDVGLAEHASTEHERSDRSAMVIEQLCRQVLAELSEIDSRQKQSLLEIKQVAIEVAIAIAGRLLMARIPAGDQNVAEMVNEAIAFFDKPGQLEVFLNPEDLGRLDQSVCEVSFAAHKRVSLQPDPGVDRGNCRVESETYSAVFDWKERLEHWRHELFQAVTDGGDG